MNDEMREAYPAFDKLKRFAAHTRMNDRIIEEFEALLAAYQLQQNRIDALMQNTESMKQTHDALIKKLDNYDDNYMAETRKVGALQAKLDIAVEALEEITQFDTSMRTDDYSIMLMKEAAKTALQQIQKGD